jgi:hypothetical protein
MSETTPDNKAQFFWIQSEDGSPRIRWGRVILLSASALLANALAQLLIFAVFQVPFRFGLVSAVTVAQLGFFATAIELQRQRLVSGKFVFRFNLTFLFVATLFAALFIGSVAAEIRYSQRAFQRNKEIEAQLQQLIGAGDVTIGALNGNRISCRVTRPTFSDDDFALLVELTQCDQSGISEITMLQIENTSVTEIGIQKLVACKKLEFLALPTIKLSDSAVNAIASCRNLKHISIGQRALTEEQRSGLYKKLPNVRINGMNFQDYTSRYRPVQ